MPYSPQVMDHFAHPRNVGDLDTGDPDVGTGVAALQDCGDLLKLQFRVGPDRRIAEARCKTYGCAAAIAAGSLLTEWLPGRPLPDAAALPERVLVEALELDPDHRHAARLALDALASALADWRSRHPGE